ncbi:MAG: hypothetical protein R3317_04410 [Burkholderiaceae bacterium]|nr:hypothetical protein [Burkholderiaceae bacterium]
MSFTSLDAVELAREGLAHRLNEAVINDIVENAVANFRKTLLEEIKATGLRISLERLESFRDVMHFRDEVVAHIQISTPDGQRSTTTQPLSHKA